MRYALMANEGNGLRRGGPVKMADAGSVTKALEALQRAGQGASKAERANAATMHQFKQMVAREAPEQYKPITDAMRQSAQTGLEHSVIGNTNSGGESFVTRGTKTSVEPNKSDTRIALQAAGNPDIIDFHTHPANLTTFGVDPSPKDLAAYSDVYRRMAKERELRTLIAIPPERVEFLSRDIARPRTAYNFFATNEPSVLSAKTADDMRYELQRAGGRGAFDAVRSDPRFKDYFENYGDMGDTLGDAASLMMQRYRALQGKGRHELQLSGAPMDSGSEVTNSALFDALLNPAMQVLEGKKFAEGGGVHMEEGGRPPLRSLNEEPTMDQIRFELSQMAKQRAVPTVDPAEVANNARLIAERQTPVDLSAPPPDVSEQFGVNAKPASQAYTNYEYYQQVPGAGAVPRTAYDDRMEELNKQLDRGVKPDWMSDTDFAQSQVDRGRGGGNILKALGSILSIPEHATGSSMGLDPMLGLIGKTGELHSIPKAGQYAASRVAPFASKVDDMVRELHASGAIPRPGLSIKDVTPRVLAPANEQGFYSPTEAAALNLQRKSGNGQAFLNDILKQENVKPDEISAMGLDTWLKGKKNVTAAEVQDYIAQNKLKLGEATYQEKPSIFKFAVSKGMSEDDAAGVVIKAQEGNPKAIEIVNAYENFSTPKYEDYSMPGGENYREVVLTLPFKNKNVNAALTKFNLAKELFDADNSQPNYFKMKMAEQELDIAKNDKSGSYKSSHWDEPNPLAHLRMSDRVTDGKKTLLVDEVQSDWHQAGRESGYFDPKKPWEVFDPKDGKPIASYATKEEAKNHAMSSPNLDYEHGSSGSTSSGNKVPNAPYKDDWYQLALRRAVKEAIDGGYDRVALPTGARVAERFDLSKQVDRIDYRKTPDGTYAMSAIKDGKIVFSKESLDEKELAGTVGKDVAQKIVGGEGSSYGFNTGANPTMSLKGLDLQVGGEGMKKYYDEIYPGYLKKFGKKYGASIGKTTVDVDGAAEPLHYMDITPAMRKEFSTGIHMKKGGKVSFTDSLDAMRHELHMRQ